MSYKKFLLTVVLAFSGWSVAQAQQAWAWSYSGPGVTASGTFTTPGSAVTFEDVSSLAGTRNGVAIAGLVPIGADPSYLYDNQFTSGTPHFTDGGLLFAMADGSANVNLYYFEGTYTDLTDEGFALTDVSFSVTAVPEPATALAMLGGLGLLGLQQLRRRRAAA